MPLEDLCQRMAEQRRREQEQKKRRAAHERMREQQESAAARRAAAPGPPEPWWPALPTGYYDQDGNPAPTPARRRPVTNEARIRQVGRLPHVVFHSDALNSPFFRQVPMEGRCEALHRVLDLLLRAPSKGMMVIGSEAITVTGKRVTMTLTPDCASVRTLNPPRPGRQQRAPAVPG